MRALLVLLSIGAFVSLGFSQSTPANCDEVVNLPQERPYLVSLADRSPRTREEQTLAVLTDHFQEQLYHSDFKSEAPDVIVSLLINRRGEVAEFTADELPPTLTDSLAASLAEFTLIPARYQDRDVCSQLTMFVPLTAPNAAGPLKIAQVMPRFASDNCDSDFLPAGYPCHVKAMLETLYKNIKYPPLARENGIEGTAIVTFVVNADGTTRDHRLLRNPGGGTGEEALRVITQHMTEWIPGQQDGKPVDVQFNLPVKFKLE